MAHIRTIAELPFFERDPEELLRLDEERAGLDLEYTGHGYCFLDSIWLDSRDGTEARHVAGALVLAIHSAEEPELLTDDVELEFAEEGVTVLLSKFLECWLPRLEGGHRKRATAGPIVLALCNPHAATVAAPEVAGRRQIHYGLGDVDSWRDEENALRLLADTWRIAEGGQR